MDTKYGAQARYTAANCSRFELKVNRRTESDILEIFNSLRENTKQTYIKELIRADIDGEKKYLKFAK